MKENIIFKKIIRSADYRKKIISAACYLAFTFLATHQAAISQTITQNHANFAKALSTSCKKKMKPDTCKCYADKVIRRYNEIQVISIYKRMIEDKNAQEMFFISTSPELLSCMDEKIQ